MTPKLIINVQPESNVNYKDEKPNNRPEQNAIPNVSHLIGLSPSYEKPDSKKAVGPILFHPEPYQPKPEEHQPGNPFDFNYAVNDVETSNDYKHNAVSDGDVTRGEYRVALPDGRTQVVKYTADWKKGYNAEVTYEGEAQYPEDKKAFDGYKY
ncbi:unnamed protein product [Diamesa serratosioi]